MKFLDIYKNKNQPVISFEIFPPKTSNGMEKLKTILNELVALSPDFITVTYGAMGTTRKKTVEIANYIKNQLKMETACHLTCVGSSSKEIDSILNKIHKYGIKNIVALRGDPPKGKSQFKPSKDGYSHANELVEHIRRFEKRNNYPAESKFGIAIAGYPEKHLEAPSFEVDLKNLKKKVDAGADVIITQLFFDNRYYFDFVDKVRNEGINIPVIPGLMPILSVNQIKKITTMCGSTIPDNLINKLNNASDNDAYAEEIGINQCIEQSKELLKNGAPGIHYYVLNKSYHIKRILNSVMAD